MRNLLKTICFILMMLVFLQGELCAKAEIDWTSMTDEEIVIELQAGQNELLKRNNTSPNDSILVEENNTLEANNAETDTQFIDTDLISYEELIRYKELFDPQMEGLENGRVPIKIEVIISNVTDTKDGYEIDMWIKGEKGYYYQHEYYTSKYPEKPKAGQRIIYELTPYSDGSFAGEQIKSFKVIENNVNFEDLNPAKFTNYSSLKNMMKDNSFSYSDTFVIDFVIGDQYNNQYEIWIKDENGYQRELFYAFGFTPKYGQRIIAVVEPYFVTLLSDTSIQSYLIAEDHVDVQSIENNYFLTANEASKRFVEPFDRNAFEILPYKRIMRNYDEYNGFAIIIEGTYQQILDDSHGLIADNDNNYYHLYIRKKVADFKLLEKDKIVVYGFIVDEPYEYSAWTGKKTIPSIFVKHIDLLEED